jgi:hypothetical protein
LYTCALEHRNSFATSSTVRIPLSLLAVAIICPSSLPPGGVRGVQGIWGIRGYIYKRRRRRRSRLPKFRNDFQYGIPHPAVALILVSIRVPNELGLSPQANSAQHDRTGFGGFLPEDTCSRGRHVEDFLYTPTGCHQMVTGKISK